MQEISKQKKGNVLRKIFNGWVNDLYAIFDISCGRLKMEKEVIRTQLTSMLSDLNSYNTSLCSRLVNSYLNSDSFYAYTNPIFQLERSRRNFMTPEEVRGLKIQKKIIDFVKAEFDNPNTSISLDNTKPNENLHGIALALLYATMHPDENNKFKIGPNRELPKIIPLTADFKSAYTSVTEDQIAHFTPLFCKISKRGTPETDTKGRFIIDINKISQIVGEDLLKPKQKETEEKAESLYMSAPEVSSFLDRTKGNEHRRSNRQGNLRTSERPRRLFRATRERKQQEPRQKDDVMVLSHAENLSTPTITRDTKSDFEQSLNLLIQELECDLTTKSQTLPNNKTINIKGLIEASTALFGNYTYLALRELIEVPEKRAEVFNKMFRDNIKDKPRTIQRGKTPR